MKTLKHHWPIKITVGNATVKVYRRITGSGNVGFMVAYCDTDGKRKFESSSVEIEAMKLAQRKAETLSTFGARVAGTSGDQIAEFVRVSDLLKPFGVSVGAVVDRVVTWLQKHGTIEAIDRALSGVSVVARQPRAVAAVVEEVLELKTANGCRDAYKKSLKSRLNKFARAFKCDISTVTAADIQRWLDGLKLEASTYNNLRTVTHTLFEHCVKRGYIEKNPVDQVEQREVRRKGDAEIYTPDEMKKLLAAATNGFQARLAISAFAGIRTAELRRLSWSAVNFDEGNLVVSFTDSKLTGSRRVVPMSANLRAWLLTVKDKDRKGKICTAKNDTAFWDEQKACAVKAGVTWKDNGLRHSFCSYRLAVTQDAAKVAFEAGNSATMIHRYYKALVTEQAARDWFAIVPKSTP